MATPIKINPDASALGEFYADVEQQMVEVHEKKLQVQLRIAEALERIANVLQDNRTDRRRLGH